MSKYQEALNYLSNASHWLNDDHDLFHEESELETNNSVASLQELIDFYAEYFTSGIKDDPVEHKIRLIRKGYTVVQFAELSGLNYTTLNHYFKGVKVFNFFTIEYMLKIIDELPVRRKVYK